MLDGVVIPVIALVAAYLLTRMFVEKDKSLPVSYGSVFVAAAEHAQR